MNNTKFCSECGKWLVLPLRRQREWWRAHMRDTHPATYAAMRVVEHELIGEAS